MKLNIYYDSETDTLSLWNGQPANEGADVAENLTADFNAEGEVIGFTLEHAAELLESVMAASPLASADATDSTTAGTVDERRTVSEHPMADPGDTVLDPYTDPTKPIERH